MATRTGDDIAELRELLQDCCNRIAGLTDAALLRSMEGVALPVAETPVAAAVASALPGSGSGGGPVSAERAMVADQVARHPPSCILGCGAPAQDARTHR